MIESFKTLDAQIRRQEEQGGSLEGNGELECDFFRFYSIFFLILASNGLITHNWILFDFFPILNFNSLITQKHVIKGL